MLIIKGIHFTRLACKRYKTNQALHNSTFLKINKKVEIDEPNII